jgi:hypothetical protein
VTISTRRGRLLIGAVIALGGSLALVLTWMAAPPRAGSGWVTVDATVSVIVDAGKDRACRADLVQAPVFDYVTPQGTFSEVGATWCNFGDSVDTWVVGDTTEVAYDPADPATAVVVGEGSPPYPRAFLGVGAAFTAFGLYLAWTSRRLPDGQR